MSHTSACGYIGKSQDMMTFSITYFPMSTVSLSKAKSVVLFICFFTDDHWLLIGTLKSSEEWRDECSNKTN